MFLSDPGVPGPIYGCVCLWNLTNATLADEDTKSILTDNANRVIQGKFSSEKKLCSEKKLTIASGAIWWPNLQQMQEVPCCC